MTAFKISSKGTLIVLLT